MSKQIILICITSLFLMCLVSLGHTQRREPCDDKVSLEIVSMEYPGELSIPDDKTYQSSATYKHSYIFSESFEENDFSQAFQVDESVNWETQAGETKDGNRLLVYSPSSYKDTDIQIERDVNNWIVVGPFDLSSAEKASFNFYIKLGDSENDRSASLSVLISVNGSVFHGKKYRGTTCDWYYRNINLTNVPDLGNVCGTSSVWFAFVPGSPLSESGGSIALDHIRLLSFNPKLPPKYSMPVNGEQESSVSPDELLIYYSPYIIQDLDDTEFGDYITCFHYDGDYNAANNWDDLGIDCGSDCESAADGCHQRQPLPAYVYGSFMETATHYYLLYAIFHPADDYHSGVLSNHENDLEGIVVMVYKDGSSYGSLRMVQLQAHSDYFQYVPSWLWPPDEHGIYPDKGDVDDVILTYDVDGIHPVVYVEGGGHGLRDEPGGAYADIDPPYIHYIYRGVAEELMYPSAYNTDAAYPVYVADWQRVGYDLLPISVEFWQRRTNCCGWGKMLMDWGGYLGYRALAWGDPDFNVIPLGMSFDGNTCMDGSAQTPWAWEDNDDIDCGDTNCPMTGDWFMDPAFYHFWQFWWDDVYYVNYEFNSFIYNHLGGEIYYKLHRYESPAKYYHIIYDVIVPADKNGLYIDPLVQIIFSPEKTMTAESFIFADGSTGTIRFTTEQSPLDGIKIDGRLRMQNGGSIKIY